MDSTQEEIMPELRAVPSRDAGASRPEKHTDEAVDHLVATATETTQRFAPKRAPDIQPGQLDNLDRCLKREREFISVFEDR